MKKPCRVLIIPDKFKGTLTGRQAALAIARGWRKTRPKDELDLLPMSDGGDGFGEVISELAGAAVMHCQTVDAAHRPTQAAWWWQAKARLAIIESARVVGLAMLPAGRYHPFELDTLGLAHVIEAARRKGARDCLVGIGGSATNDGGFGMAVGLGWKFLDTKGKHISHWPDLANLETVIPACFSPENPRIRVAVDVRNPLLGKSGCSCVYGPQKGLQQNEMPLAETCLRRISQKARPPWSASWAKLPGAGAAGGLGFGLRCFCRAELLPGFQLYARLAGLSQRLHDADVVITGEGRIDASTLMGKGVGEVLRLCLAKGQPCYGLAGALGQLPEDHGFTLVRALSPGLTDELSAKNEPGKWLGLLASQVARTV